SSQPSSPRASAAARERWDRSARPKHLRSRRPRDLGCLMPPHEQATDVRALRKDATVNDGDMTTRRWALFLLLALVAAGTASCGRTAPELAMPFDSDGRRGGRVDEVDGSPAAPSAGGDPSVGSGGTVPGATRGSGGSGG